MGIRPKKCVYVASGSTKPCGGPAKFCLLKYKTAPVPTHCKTHCSPGMVNVTAGKMCTADVNPPCSRKVAYGPPGESAEVCSMHMTEGMVKTRADREAKKIAEGVKFYGYCFEDGCTLKGSFAIPDDEEDRVWCEEHKIKGAIATDARTCKHESGCKTRASFNYPGNTMGIRCYEHREEGMKDVVNDKCEGTGCETKPYFNYIGEKKGRFCNVCKLDGMVNVCEDRFCGKDGCKTRRSYGFPDGPAEYCSVHALPGMENVVSDRCQKDSCTTIPNYNFPGEKRGKFCQQHADPGMVDVVNYICEKCDRNALYGVPESKPIRCIDHRMPNMVIDPRRKCGVDGCRNSAVFGKDTHKRCSTHKEDGDVNITEQICISCELPAIIRGNGLCSMCDPNAFQTMRLAKQNAVEDILKANGLVFVSKDKTIDAGICGRSRPDFVFDCGTHHVVLEVDENQHRGYVKECEITRMKEISQSIGMPTIFVRYNPDKYNINGKIHDTSNTVRTNTLIEVMHYYMSANIDQIREYGYLSAVYLYYDGYNSESMIPVRLTGFDQVV